MRTTNPSGALSNPRKLRCQLLQACNPREHSLERDRWAQWARSLLLLLGKQCNDGGPIPATISSFSPGVPGTSPGQTPYSTAATGREGIWGFPKPGFRGPKTGSGGGRGSSCLKQDIVSGGEVVSMYCDQHSRKGLK